ncbi:ThiF family protein [Bathymodiolus thermophilus thioautotrophic gill symbiont]|uniref:ThiF family protein n=1 Tax=Bathymodiolus thermophilus thioautotrophic gill symbiont TaxID=2360 RepID=A0A3G3IMN0_9GAMM|nr:ThiF family adenylyltransferase [Bathymodiolus thermophilus thioautotrophic gill symbiont]AYQ57045.1 ThiF family protein [Bathymodiolus thermophilus thioautotrophic gill symbiont]
MTNDLTTSTNLAIGDDLLTKIQNNKFSIVGCGGVGSLFAEMLVRTGANNISLIDSDCIERKNLNRTPFLVCDVGKYKVEILEKRLKAINSTINIKTIPRNFGTYIDGDNDRQEVRDLVVDSDITIIAIDSNDMRVECEQLLNDVNNQYLVVGVEINENISRFVCGWMTKTPNFEKDLKGYGENNGSYMPIVSEAVSVGFHLMMHHMKDGDFKKENYIERKYVNYFPVDNSQEQ